MEDLGNAYETAQSEERAKQKFLNKVSQRVTSSGNNSKETNNPTLTSTYECWKKREKRCLYAQMMQDKWQPHMENGDQSFQGRNKLNNYIYIVLLANNEIILWEIYFVIYV